MILGEPNTRNTAKGFWQFDSLQVPNGAVGNTQFSSSDPLTVAKQRHQYKKLYQQNSTITVASDTGRVLHVARQAGTIVEFLVGIVALPSSWAGGGQFTVDLKKNGTTVLSSIITVVQATIGSAYGTTPGAFSSSNYIAGDVLEAVTVYIAGSGTGPKGLFVELLIDEGPG